MTGAKMRLDFDSRAYHSHRAFSLATAQPTIQIGFLLSEALTGRQQGFNIATVVDMENPN